jgi:hypothetical protein
VTTADESRMRVNPHVRFDEGEGDSEANMVCSAKAQTGKPRHTLCCNLHLPLVPSLLYPQTVLLLRRPTVGSNHI